MKSEDLSRLTYEERRSVWVADSISQIVAVISFMHEGDVDQTIKIVKTHYSNLMDTSDHQRKAYDHLLQMLECLKQDAREMEDKYMPKKKE